jgi:hypothetical protein
MAIEDILSKLPNVFVSTPEAYRGLLMPEKAASLERRANIGGLLGFGAALAQGMSPQGYRRSALQNVLTALGAGYGAAGQTYEAGIGQLANLQKLQQSQAQIDAVNQVLNDPNVDPQIKALIRINPQEGIKYLMENAPLTRILSKTGATVEPRVEPRVETPQPASLITPEVRPEVRPEGLITGAVEPVNVVRTPPPAIPAGESDFADFQRQARLDAQTKSPEQISAAAKLALSETNADLAKTQIRPEKGVELQTVEAVPVMEYREPVAAPAPVVAAAAPVSVPAAPRVSDDLARLNARRNALLTQNEELSILPSKRADEIIDRNTKQIKTIDDQIGRLSVSQYDFDAVERLVPPEFKPSVMSLRQAAQRGTLSMKDMLDKLQSIEKNAIDFVTKQKDYTNQDRRVFGGMFPNPDGTPRSIETASPVELMQLENKLYEMRISEKKAGATTINLPSESERTAGYLTTRLKNSFAQYQAVLGQNPEASLPSLRAEIVKGVTRSDYLKNLVTPEARQRVEAAQLDMLDAALTMATGAAYTREQLESTRSTYFPALGDKPENIRDKANRLDKLLKEAAMTKAGRAAPSGVAPAFDIDAITRELESRKKGK